MLSKLNVMQRFHDRKLNALLVRFFGLIVGRSYVSDKRMPLPQLIGLHIVGHENLSLQFHATLTAAARRSVLVRLMWI